MAEAKKTGAAEGTKTRKPKRKRITTGRVIAAAAGVAAATAAGIAVAKGRSKGRTVYHVQPEGDDWVVKGEGAKRASSRHDTKNDAVSAGRETAKKRLPSQLVVHKADGSVDTSYSYEKEIS